MNNNTANQKEIEKFSKLSSEWWNPKGKFKPLHKFNPIRQEYLVDQISNNYKIDLTKKLPFQNLKILDVGCGGGLLSEPFARLGAKTTGIDASSTNIEVAKYHANEMGLNIDYRCCKPEDIQNETFDVILCMEIIEHVDNVDFFIESCVKILKKNGLIFFATLNKTIKSYFLAIVGAEYILRWLPIGTHDWHKFLKPQTIINKISKHYLNHENTTGVVFNPFLNQWKLSDDTDVNYIVFFKKN
jgi:2-polyprenyl-6-hydroxyphenyl methylase/3-demethylubiquinone-9 3-methyltransferase